MSKALVSAFRNFFKISRKIKKKSKKVLGFSVFNFQEFRFLKVSKLQVSCVYTKKESGHVPFFRDY